jgi:hypothetical protein
MFIAVLSTIAPGEAKPALITPSASNRRYTTCEPVRWTPRRRDMGLRQRSRT